MSQKWTFEQVEGPISERKTLELEGWSAPFGRPRKDPVIKETLKSRIQTTRYPGSSGQTRHAFGTNLEPTEMKGRWMTKAGGKVAGEIADDWAAFVADERTCRISWGLIVSYIGYIEELELGRESEHEIAWKMKLQIDWRDDKKKLPSGIPFPRADKALVDIGNWQEFSKTLALPTLPHLSTDFLDSLDNIAAELNKPAALANKLAGEFSDTVRATFSTLQHFRNAIAGIRTAMLSIRETVLEATIDSVLLVRTAEADLNWVRYQADLDNQTAIFLDQLNKLDRNAELQQQEEPTRFVAARQDDTWEAISTRATGGPDKAASIRRLNGIKYGEAPVAGESYLVK